MHLDFVLAAGQNHFFRELVDDLVRVLTPLVRRVSISVGGPAPAADDTIWVLCPPHEAMSLGLGWMFEQDAMMARTIGVCAEQPATKWFDDNVELAARLGAVFDISDLGVAALRDHGIDAHRLCLGATDRAAPRISGGASHSGRVGLDAGADRPIDIAIMWSETERRGEALDRLLPLLDGLAVVAVRSSNDAPLSTAGPRYLGSDARHELLSRSKVLFNMHRATNPYFEWLRCLSAFEAGAVFVNETDVGCAPLRAGAEFFSLGGPWQIDDVDWLAVAAQLRSLCHDRQQRAQYTDAADAWLAARPLSGAAGEIVAVAEALLSHPVPPFAGASGVASWAVTQKRCSDLSGSRPDPLLVELWGTFDVDNLGDQLFPVVARHRLQALHPAATITLASPLGGLVPGWQGEVGPFAPVAATARRIIADDEPGFFEQTGMADAIVVPGGDVIHSATPSLMLANGQYVEYPFAALAGSPAVLGARTAGGWHGVGVPAPLEGRLVRCLAQTIDNLAAVSVRDEASVEHLGVTGRPVAVVADPIWMLPAAWSSEQIDMRHDRLVGAGNLPSDPYLCVHHSFLDDADLETLTEQVAMLRASGVVVVAISLGPCLGDVQGAVQLAERSGATAFTATTVPERVAALAGAGGYIGTSVHGGIVAASYGVSSAWIRDVAKTRMASAALGGDRLIVIGEVNAMGQAMMRGERPIDESVVSALARRAMDELDETLRSVTAVAEQRRRLHR